MAAPISPDPKFEELRKQYYNSENVMFQLCEGLKYREGVFIRLPTERLKHTTIRCCKMWAVRFIRMNFERYRFQKHPYNVYASVAKYPNMPMLSFNNDRRREEMDDFNKSYWSLMEAYDFLLDIDNADLRIAYATAYKTKQLFASANIPFTLMFSGNKGFHIRVTFEDFPQDMQALPKPELIDILKRFAQNFKAVNGLHSIDLSIFDGRRIAKTCYSVVYPNYLIALPLSDEEMDNFTLEYCSIVHWLKPENMSKLYRRGMCRNI
jgi:hypothetical protein